MVRNTVPVGSRGSSGVKACSIAGYGFCMEKKRSPKLNFPKRNSATGVSIPRQALWTRHCERPGRCCCGQGKSPRQRLEDQDPKRQSPRRASFHLGTGGEGRPPSSPRPRPASPRGQPRTYTMAGGATSDASEGCGSDGSAARRSAAGPGAPRLFAGGGLVRERRAPPLPERS